MDDLFWQKRMRELCTRAENRHCAVYSDFLTTAQQDELESIFLSNEIVFDGGYLGAERKIACFGAEYKQAWEREIECIEITVPGKKFEKPLCHRDYLGSLMSLGMKREMFGDIVLTETGAYLFLLSSVTEYILENFTSVAHSKIECKLLGQLPDIVVNKDEPVRVVVSSTRLDCMVAGAFKLSRSESAELIVQKKVFVNGTEKTKPDFNVSLGDKISVRGKGRFVFVSENSKTKKDRLNVSLIINK